MPFIFASTFNAAKKSLIKLSESDSDSDQLIVKASTLKQSIEQMKEYHELGKNERVFCKDNPSRSSLIVSIQTELKQLQKLEMENKKLKNDLEEHQMTLNLLMNKYRQYAANFNSNLSVEKTYHLTIDHNSNLNENRKKALELLKKIFDEINVNEMKVADSNSKTIERLKAENQVIRQILNKAGICMSSCEENELVPKGELNQQ